MSKRRIAKQIKVGDVAIGGGAPIVVQSMTKSDTRDIVTTINQIHKMEEHGCEIVRVAVPDREAAEAIANIKKAIRIPLIADIHFDYRLALAALEAGADGLRLNPGNIRDQEHIRAVARAAKERGAPIRVGVNAGSLPPPESQCSPLPQRMVEAALWEIRLLERYDFGAIKVSLKAFDVPTTVEAYRLMAERTDYPLHIGITEAGLPMAGAIRSAVGLGILLHQGIGDTLRVSLTGDPESEVIAAWEILKSLNLRQRGATLISCPTCGRCEVDLVSLAKAVDELLRHIGKDIKVAVMGCIVNGPGEAKEADVGIACGRGRGAIFRKGQVVATVEESKLVEALMAEIKAL